MAKAIIRHTVSLDGRPKLMQRRRSCAPHVGASPVDAFLSVPNDDHGRAALRIQSPSRAALRIQSPSVRPEDGKVNLSAKIAEKKGDVIVWGPAHSQDRHGTRLPRILCYGDSNTAGYHSGGKLFQPYGQALASELLDMGVLCEVMVCGLSGYTTEDMLNEQASDHVRPIVGPHGRGLSRMLDEDGPIDLVIIMTGTNDLAANTNMTTIVHHISQLHAVCHKRSVPTIAMAATQATGRQIRIVRQKLADLVSAWAASAPNVLAYLDVEDVLPRPMGKDGSSNIPAAAVHWQPDQLHLSATGSIALGRRLATHAASWLQRLVHRQPLGSSGQPAPFKSRRSSTVSTNAGSERSDSDFGASDEERSSSLPVQSQGYAACDQAQTALSNIARPRARSPSPCGYQSVMMPKAGRVMTSADASLKSSGSQSMSLLSARERALITDRKPLQHKGSRHVMEPTMKEAPLERHGSPTMSTRARALTAGDRPLQPKKIRPPMASQRERALTTASGGLQSSLGQIIMQLVRDNSSSTGDKHSKLDGASASPLQSLVSPTLVPSTPASTTRPTPKPSPDLSARDLLSFVPPTQVPSTSASAIRLQRSAGAATPRPSPTLSVRDLQAFAPVLVAFEVANPRPPPALAPRELLGKRFLPVAPKLSL